MIWKTLLLITGGLLMIRFADSPEVQVEEERKSFSAEGVKKIKVENLSGLISFEGGEPLKTHELLVEKIEWNKSCDLVVKASKGEIFVKVKNKALTVFNFSGKDCVAHVRFHSPKKVDLKLTTGSGDLKVSAVQGDVELKSGSGKAEVSSIEGELETHLGSGNLVVKNVKGAVDLSTGSGNITVDSVVGETELRAGSGNIKLSHIEGKTKLRTGSGDLFVKSSAMLEFDGNLGSGDASLEGDFKDFDLRSGSGDVKVSFQKLTEKGKVRVRSGSGDISLSFPSQTKAKFELKTRSGVLKQGLTSFPKSSYVVKIDSGSGDIKVF